MLPAREKCIRQLAPVRVTESEEIGLMRQAACLDRSLSWVRRQAYREYILSHGGTLDEEPEDIQAFRASQWDSRNEMT